jgi:hypothetical protein
MKKLLRRKTFDSQSALLPRIWFAFLVFLAGALQALSGFAAPSGRVGGTDINLITGTETSPHVTQSESSIWGHGETVVVVYNDSREAALNPINYCGASVPPRRPSHFRVGAER